ncbi:related to fluconazole resistance (FLU1) [Lecanosticta acicola]|uniref:Related to fluconazole resistance (FLU1) n=1 Tax=Lecanosticta acicola TaxID=111012 RepID=A0AAI8Z298_9PEZI|nr:related to fluconazole resistance (FLU1) [Lecanosticta acicola]
MADTASRLEKEPSEKQILSFEDSDPENPYNWTLRKKLWILLIGSLLVFNSTLGAALPSGASLQLQQHFHVTSESQLVLPNSIYLVGYVLGPLLFAPQTENYGRRWILIGTYSAFTLFMMAVALAPNWGAFVGFRFLAGLFGNTPISVTGGLYADVFDNPVHRGWAVAWYLVVASLSIGPIPGGCLSVFSWHWPFWFGFILAAVCLVPLLFLPETFGPVILAKRAKKLRKAQRGANIYGALELKHTGVKQYVTKIVGRPLKFLTTEPIVTASCMYLSLIYGILFIFFQAFDVIFPPIYNFTQCETGLAFIPLCIGNFLALPIVIWWDRYLRSAKKRQAPWSSKEEYQRLPLACLGGPLFTIGMFWLGWGAMSSVPWIVPLLGAVLVGTGFVLVFVALFNYLVDSYKVYSASALGATSLSRSTFGVALPFAAKPMYDTLGVAWACSLLGFLSLVMCVIPFAFIRYGERLRASSPICKELASQSNNDSGSRQKA